MKTDFDAWLETAKDIGKDFLEDLSGDEKEVAVSCIKDMATMKAKGLVGQPATYSRELQLIESTLIDLKAIVAIDVLRNLRELARRSAGQFLPILEGLFGKVIAGL